MPLDNQKLPPLCQLQVLSLALLTFASLPSYSHQNRDMLEQRPPFLTSPSSTSLSLSLTTSSILCSLLQQNSRVCILSSLFLFLSLGPASVSLSSPSSHGTCFHQGVSVPFIHTARFCAQRLVEILFGRQQQLTQFLSPS